jgi:hypothetical protein
MIETIPKLSANDIVIPRPINRKGEYADTSERLDARTYSPGDTGSQFTASLEARPPACPSSKSIPDRIIAEVRMTGVTIRD